MAVWGYSKYIKVQDEEPRKRCPGCTWVLLDDELGGGGGGNGIYAGSDTLTQLNTVATIPSGGTFAFAGDFVGNLLLLDGDSGKVTIDGLLDPSGVQFTQQASNPGDPNTIWIDNTLGHAFRGDVDLENFLEPQAVYRDNILLEGGVVCEETGLDCFAYASRYVIGNVYYDTLITSSFTLSPPDLTHPRIDVVVIDNTGTISVIEGTPEASPVKPDIDEETQLELGFAIVNVAGDVSNVSQILIFNENVGAPTEFTVTTAPTGGNPADATQVFNGATSYYIPQTVTTDILRFTTASEIILDPTDSLIFAFRTDLAWGGGDRLRVKLVNTVTGDDSDYKVIRTNNDQSYGLDLTTANQWQLVVIPLGDFNNADTQYDGVEFKFDNTTPGTDVWLDYIRIQGGVFIPTPSADGNGIYTGSGRVPDGTIATLSGEMIFQSGGGEVSFNTTFGGITDRTNLLFSSDTPIEPTITPPYSIIYNGRQTGSGNEIIALGTTSQVSPNIFTQLAMISNDTTGLADFTLTADSGFAGAGTIRLSMQSVTRGSNTSPAVTQLTATADSAVDSDATLEINSEVTTGNGNATLDVHTTTWGTGTSTLELLAVNNSTGSGIAILGADDNGTRGGITVQSTGITFGDYLSLGVSDYTFPLTRGTNGQGLITDGSGNVTWQTIGGGIYGASNSLTENHVADGNGFTFTLNNSPTITIGDTTGNQGFFSRGATQARLTSGNAILDVNGGNAVNVAINGSGVAQVYVGTAGNIANTVTTQTTFAQTLDVASTRVFEATVASSGNYDVSNAGTINIDAGTVGVFTATTLVQIGDSSLGSMSIASDGNLTINTTTGTLLLQSGTGDVNLNPASGNLQINGTNGISGTFTFGGGGSGDIASMTFTKGILTGTTLVP